MIYSTLAPVKRNRQKPARRIAQGGVAGLLGSRSFRKALSDVATYLVIFCGAFIS